MLSLPAGDLFLPEDISSFTGIRLIDRTGMVNRKFLLNGLRKICSIFEFPENFAIGLHKYLIENNIIQNRADFDEFLLFLRELKILMGGQPLFKRNSFNYITEDTGKAAIHQMRTNAEFMIGTFGADFFAQDSRGIDRKTFMKSRIPETDCCLTCQGSIGAGTFSVNLAIGADLGKPLNDTLCRIAFDIETTSSGIAVRVIAIGSTLTKNAERVPRNLEIGRRFFKKFKLSPQKALALLSLYIAYDLNAQTIKALSTTGARALSSLAKSKHPFDYSRVFASVGFQESSNANWLTVENLQEGGFYDAITTTPDKPEGLVAHQTDGLHAMLIAFQNLQFPNGERCPLTVCKGETRAELERAFRAFRIIHRK